MSQDRDLSRSKDRLSLVSTVIGLLSLVVAVATGLFDQRVASVIALGLAIFIWAVWVTAKVVILEQRQQRLPKGSEAARIPPSTGPMPRRVQLDEAPVKIETLDGKIKISPEFLEWSEFSLVFWVRIADSFLSSRNNRYLFAYTTDPSGEREGPKYPNAFFLGLLGGGSTWRFVVKGPDPVNHVEIQFPTNEALRGWKLVSVRWDRHSRKLSLDLDAGNALHEDRTVESASWPRREPNHFFHLGGWLDNWSGGLSLLEFYRFRLYADRLTDNQLSELHRVERSLVATVAHMQV